MHVSCTPEPACVQTEAISGVAVRTGGITTAFGEVAALDGVDLDVAAGQIHGVAGPDGAGKTTLSGLLLGLAVADHGTLAGLAAAFCTLQARQLYHMNLTAARLRATASCTNKYGLVASDGPGNNWRCYAHWHLPGVSNATGKAIYQPDVNANGRYIADGDGLQEVNGCFAVHTLRGRTEPAMAVRRPRRPAGQLAEGIANKCR